MEKNLKNEIKKYISDKQKVRDLIYLTIFIMFIFIILFSTAQIIKNKTNFYKNDLNFRWRNILSYDDMQYARNVYTEEKNYENIKQIVVNHPLLPIIGTVFSFVENGIYTNMNNTDHYFHIVVFQIIINIVGAVFLYKILRNQFKLSNKYCFILLTLYELATVTLLGTFTVDSFIISGTLLIMSYYYLNKQKLIPSIIIGILATGITITNCVPFALMAIFLLKQKKDIFKVGLSCILGVCLTFLLLPYRHVFINNFLDVIFVHADFYSREQTGITYIKMIFYNLLASPIFFISQVHTQIKGLDYLTFDLSSSIIVIITTIMFFAFVVYNIIQNIKNRELIAAFSVFVYNIILHAIVKFGLYEATIYGLHFLFAEILMFAFGFKIKNPKIRYVFIGFSIVMLMVQLKYNIQGMLNTIILMSQWK